MRKSLVFLSLFVLSQTLLAQKKPLDHTVYDSWQSIGEKRLSPNGEWIVYSIDVQEGNNELVIQRVDGTQKTVVSRGYRAAFTSDSRYIFFKIKPLFADTRNARIKKMKPEEMPKDSLGFLELGKDSVSRNPLVAGFEIPETFTGWMAWLAEKGKGGEKGGAELTLFNPGENQTRVFGGVSEYQFDKKGEHLLIYQLKKPKDSLGRNLVLYHTIRLNQTDTLSRGGNTFKNFTIAEDGSQVAYLAERDSSEKALQQFYGLWYFRKGMDSAQLAVNRMSTGMRLGMTVSENGTLRFSKSGRRLFFGVAAILPPRDTTVADIDKVSVDIWHYNEDYLQTVQIARKQRDSRESFLSVYYTSSGIVTVLASKELPTIISTQDGDGRDFVGVTDFGRRIESQWTGTTRKDIYRVDPETGKATLVKADVDANVNMNAVSPSGKYIAWYDSKLKHYFLHDGQKIRNLTASIKVKLYDENHDSPSEPGPYGIMGWEKGEQALLIYDRYDIWRLGLAENGKVENLTRGLGRKEKKSYRYLDLDPEEKEIDLSTNKLFMTYDETRKAYSFSRINAQGGIQPVVTGTRGDFRIASVIKAKDKEVFAFTRETFQASPDIYSLLDDSRETKLSAINPQQSQYLWGTAELIQWKAYDGRMTEGIVYKPEDFDPKKKYPMICYFYEELSNTLHNYIAPQPIRSALNIPFYTSRGYVVFVPDIRYKIGYPGKSAYDYVVSGARAVVRKGFVDSTRMAIQGHSWGGYQVAHLITRTNLFKAAWSGAPVVNMTSAYGGIRWESGLNRQFQYEKTQSRIGATLWEKRSLYLENSPLFYMDKVKTPVVILHNDADGAVPWYQGIEMFTALRRLGKKTWLLNYNGEGHGLTIRKNRLDYQIRMQQFFDWILKGEKPAKWIVEGVPAVDKGRDMGLELVDEKN